MPTLEWIGKSKVINHLRKVVPGVERIVQL